MKYCILILSFFFVACGTSVKKENFYKVEAEIINKDKVMNKPTIIVSGDEEASILVHDSKKDQLLEVQIESVEKDVYTMNVHYCENVNRLSVQEVSDIDDCTQKGVFQIKGLLNKNSLIEIKEKNFQRKFKFNVSEVPQKELLDSF